MKKIMLITMSVLVGLGLLTGCGKKKSDNSNEGNNPQEEVKVNTNEGVINDQQVETLLFEQTSLIYDGNSTLETTVTNIGSEVVNFTSFNIHVMDGDTEMVVLYGYIGDSIQPGESIILSSTYGDDITNATSVIYEIIR